MSDKDEQIIYCYIGYKGSFWRVWPIDGYEAKISFEGAAGARFPKEDGLKYITTVTVSKIEGWSLMDVDPTFHLIFRPEDSEYAVIKRVIAEYLL